MNLYIPQNICIGMDGWDGWIIKKTQKKHPPGIEPPKIKYVVKQLL